MGWSIFTFGSNPVSCAIGAEVLRVIKSEKPKAYALAVGTYLKKEFRTLAKDFPYIGGVRYGVTDFFGVRIGECPHGTFGRIDRLFGRSYKGLWCFYEL